MADSNTRSPASTPNLVRTHYDANYDHFVDAVYGEVRREAFGEDIGQNSWLTAVEQDGYIARLNLSLGKRLLDIACGAGGPALRIAEITGCSVLGIDIHEQAVSAASSMASLCGFSHGVEFRVANAAVRLPFPDAAFDAITCVDGINHLADREFVIAEWSRLLRCGGRLLFTDPTVVTGALTNAEISVRSSAGFYLFVPPGYNEDILAQCGLQVIAVEDVSRATAELAMRRRSARQARASTLRQIEGDDAYEKQQEFLAIAAQLAAEHRLSRYLYTAQR